MPTGIKNISNQALSLPHPYDGMLPAGQMAIVADTPAQAAAALADVPFVFRLLQFIALPAATTLTFHGAVNVDETLATTNPAVSLVKQTSRFDLIGAGAGVTASLGDGGSVGQRKRLFQMSALGANTVSVVPKTMAEGKTFVKLAALGAWAELEWQVGATAGGTGWKVIGIGGPTGSAASYG